MSANSRAELAVESYCLRWRPALGPSLAVRRRACVVAAKCLREPVRIMSMWLRGSIGAAIAVAGMIGPAPAGGADFARDVQPIFAAHCYECHGQREQMADLRFDDR